MACAPLASLEGMPNVEVSGCTGVLPGQSCCATCTTTGITVPVRVQANNPCMRIQCSVVELLHGVLGFCSSTAP